MAHRRRGTRREEPVVEEEKVEELQVRPPKHRGRRDRREKEPEPEIIEEQPEEVVEEDQPPPSRHRHHSRKEKKERRHKEREEEVEVEEVQDEIPQTDAEAEPERGTSDNDEANGVVAEEDQDQEQEEDSEQNKKVNGKKEHSDESESSADDNKKRSKHGKDKKKEDSVEPIEAHNNDKKKIKKRNPIIGKASERDLSVLRKIAEGKTSRFAHCFGTKSYADIKLLPSEGNGYAVASILLSTVLPESLIADTMECRETNDSLCVLDLPISDLSAKIIVNYIYDQPLESLLKELSIEDKGEILKELTEIQAIPLIDKLYSDKDLVNVGDPKSLASYITTKASSNQSLGSIRPKLTGALLKELNVPSTIYLAKQLPLENEIELKCNWCVSQEIKEPFMKEDELQKRTEEILLSIPDNSKLPSEQTIINILSTTKNILLYRFLFMRCCGIKLPLVIRKNPSTVEEKDNKK